MRSMIVAVLSLFMATVVLAWEPKDAPARPPDNGGPPRVYYAHSYFESTPHMAGLDDRISVHVQNFGTLLKNANGNCQGIVLFLDGMPIQGDKAESCDPVAGHVRYRLLRTKDDDAAWHTLRGSPPGYTHTVYTSRCSAPEEPGGTSRGFLNDVMSDPTGVSLHRFQMFVWTLVLGVIFIGSVYKNLAMPEFSATLLGLMGISSGTYLGFKVPEKQGSDTPPGAATP